jgi:hypothetical protein
VTVVLNWPVVPNLWPLWPHLGHVAYMRRVNRMALDPVAQEFLGFRKVPICVIPMSAAATWHLAECYIAKCMSAAWNLRNWHHAPDSFAILSREHFERNSITIQTRYLSLADYGVRE